MIRPTGFGVSSLFHGKRHLVARPLYGTGMRVMEDVRLRVKDVDFARREIAVRAGLIQPLELQLESAKMLHETGLREDYGAVYLPYAPEIKYPGSNRKRGWRYVLPASQTGVLEAAGLDMGCGSLILLISKKETAMQITAKGQVTLPQHIRERFGFLPRAEAEAAVKSYAPRP